MKKLTLPIGIVMLCLLFLAVACTPAADQEGPDGTGGASATETAAAYPEGEAMPPVIEPVPAEGTRPYPSLEDRPLESLPAYPLPTPAVSEPEVPGSGEESPVIGEVPADLLEEIIADVMQRTGAARSAVRVLQAEQVVWPDGSLGCPQPGQMYTQALVDGYQVVLEQDGERFDYRVAGTGYFFLCESNLNLATPTG
jgi:hypothetical protein